MSVTICSLLKNNPHHTFRIIVACSATDAVAEVPVRTTVSLFGNATIEFKTYDLTRCSNFYLKFCMTVDVYMRVFMTDYIDDSIDKILYLDSDLVVSQDIEELWNTDINGYYVAGVHDPLSGSHANLGFTESEQYFNSGVLLVNLAKWREADIIPKFIRLRTEQASTLRFHDQDVLNALFRRNVLFLDCKWNFQVGLAELSPEELSMTKKTFRQYRDSPAIVHFSSRWKPWVYMDEVHYKTLYYRYLALTPYRDYVQPDRTTKNMLIRMLRLKYVKQQIKWRVPAMARRLQAVLIALKVVNIRE